MRIIAIISFNFVLFVLMMAMVSWLEQEEFKIKAINKDHYRSIHKLQKVAQINLWLNDVVAITEKRKTNPEEVDDSLITFFDENKDKYNFHVKRYIYEDAITKNLDVSYKMNLNNKEKLADFINIEHKDGFLQFRELRMNDKTLSGKFQVVQPHNGENNASEQ